MSYTFDKAINDLENLDPEERLTKYEVRAMIELLREEYAPTVEMTEAGKNALLISLEDEEFETFFDFIEYGAYQYRGEVSIDDLMRAWLNPDVIKVVDE